MEEKQTTDWENRFQHLLPWHGDAGCACILCEWKEPLKQFISQERKKAQMELLEKIENIIYSSRDEYVVREKFEALKEEVQK